MKILFFGDIVGRIGRTGLSYALPDLITEYSPGLIIANAENIAHGKGITEATIREMRDIGVQVFTTGNHIAKKSGYEGLLNNYALNILRPANFPQGMAGRGYLVYEINSLKVAVINLMGRVFFMETLDDPFRELDTILDEINSVHGEVHAIIVDWHCEATSEKQTLGWYADGRVSAVLGTHTHVPTADARILPKGTAYISDVGMVGARDAILGVAKEGPLGLATTQVPHMFEIPESGVVQINGVYLETSEETGKIKQIERVDREVVVS